MKKNSTLKLLDYLLKKKYASFDKLTHKIISEKEIKPKKETIDTIISYAKSVEAIKTKSKDKLLICLN